jgi:hypothetical protein
MKKAEANRAAALLQAHKKQMSPFKAIENEGIIRAHVMWRSCDGLERQVKSTRGI